jgi:hypothetical protein
MKTGLTKDHISKLKTRDNLESNTIEKFINLSSNLTLEQIQELFYLNHSLPLDWENLTLLNLQTQEELINFTLLLKHFNNHPQMISRLELFIKSIKPNKFIEKIYEELFPLDEARNLLKTRHSLLLNKKLISELMSKRTKIFEFYGDGPSDIIQEEYENFILDDDDSEFRSNSYLYNMSSRIIHYFRAKTADEHLEEFFEGRIDDSIESIPELIEILNLNPEPFITFDILTQYDLFLATPMYEEELVSYSDGTKGYEEVSSSPYIELDLHKYSVDSKNLSPEFISKLVNLGFTQVDDRLFIDFYKV